MKNVMRCDQVFEILTRGPFPAGHPGEAAAVERHLQACYECRNLAEALRPAVGLIHEALAEEESLPAYHGSLDGSASLIANGSRRGPLLEGSESDTTGSLWEPDSESAVTFSLSSRNGRSSSPERSRLGIRGIVHLVVAVALGVCIFALWGRFRPASPPGTPPLASADVPLGPAVRNADELAALNLSPACFRPLSSFGESAEPGGRASRQHQCCTKCHFALRDPKAVPAVRLSNEQLAMLGRSCVICHEI